MCGRINHTMKEIATEKNGTQSDPQGEPITASEICVSLNMVTYMAL